MGRGAHFGEGVVFGGWEGTFAIIVAALEDGAGPFAEEALGGAFDAEFWFFGFGVEEDDFADAGGDEGFFVDGEFGEGGEELALDVVGGELAVGEGFEEKRTDSRRLFSGSTMADSTSRELRLRRAVTSGRRRSLCMAGWWAWRASTSSWAASAMRMRRLAISSSAIAFRSWGLSI